MNVAELFQGLSFGHLRHLYAGLGGSGSVKLDDQDRLVFFANQTLKQIYSRFAHNLYYVNLELIAGRQSYPIRPAYALSDATPGNTNPRYIKDSSDDPFTGGLIKIRAVELISDPTNHEAKTGNLLLNDGVEQAVVRTTSFDTLYFRNPVGGARYRLELQMAHPALSIPAVPSQEIYIAPVLEEALLSKVSASVFATMNGEENAMRAQQLDAAFENVAQLITLEDLLQQSSSAETTQLHDNGWI